MICNHKISLLLHNSFFSTILNRNMNIWYESPQVDTHSSKALYLIFLRQVVLLHEKLGHTERPASSLDPPSHSSKLGSTCLQVSTEHLNSGPLAWPVNTLTYQASLQSCWLCEMEVSLCSLLPLNPPASIFKVLDYTAQFRPLWATSPIFTNVVFATNHAHLIFILSPCPVCVTVLNPARQTLRN